MSSAPQDRASLEPEGPAAAGGGSEDPLAVDPAWRIVRIAGGMAAGLVVLFGLVLVSTWVAALATGLGPGDDPTTGYLLLNLAGSVLAAVLAGMTATRMGRSRIAPALLAMCILAIGAVAGGQAAQDGQPGWYPLTVTLLGAGGVLLGAFLAPRETGPSATRRAGAAAGPSV